MKSVQHLVSIISYWCFLKYFLSSCPTELSLRWRQYMYVISQLMGAFISIAARTCKLAWFLYFLQGKVPFICTMYQLYIIKVKFEHMPHYTWCHEDGTGGWVRCRVILLNLGTIWRWVVSFKPQLLYPWWRSPWCMCGRKLGGLQRWSGCCAQEENLLPLLWIEHCSFMSCLFCRKVKQ